MLRFPTKMLRAKVIKEYIGDKKCVCFSCGNASRELILAGIDTLCIGGDNGVFQPTKWFTQKEISEIFPNYFDATSGHLSMEVMKLIAKEYRNYLGELDKQEYEIPSGSGETLVCLKLVYPDKDFIAVYDNNDSATTYDELAPLNDLVKLLAKNVIIKEVQK